MIIQSEGLGLTLLVFSLCCLGTWPALLRLCSFHPSHHHNEPHEVGPEPSFFSTEQRNSAVAQSFYRDTEGGVCVVRHICHVYMDYATAYFWTSSLPLLLVLYLAGDEVISSAMAPSLIWVAMLGGALLSYGNLSLQWSTVIYGAPLTTTLALQASLTVVLGTFLNYALEPTKTHHPTLLAVGVVVFLVAISLAAKAQMVYATSMTSSLQSCHGNTIYREIELPYGSSSSTTPPAAMVRRPHNSYSQYDDAVVVAAADDDEPNSGSATSPTNEEISEYAKRKQRKRTLKGILVAVSGGMAFGFFSPAFNIAVNDPFQWSNQRQQHQQTAATVGASLDVARTNLWFSFAFWMASMVGNVLLLHREEHQSQLSSSFGSTHYSPIPQVLWVYLTKDSMAERQVALLAGVVCALGNALQFQGGKLVGYATADLVQAYPLVSTLWDIFLFREFAHVRPCSWLGGLLFVMYAAYLSGIALLACSSVI